jgi:hypothetical protein
VKKGESVVDCRTGETIYLPTPDPNSEVKFLQDIKNAGLPERDKITKAKIVRFPDIAVAPQNIVNNWNHQKIFNPQGTSEGRVEWDNQTMMLVRRITNSTAPSQTPSRSCHPNISPHDTLWSHQYWRTLESVETSPAVSSSIVSPSSFKLFGDMHADDSTREDFAPYGFGGLILGIKGEDVVITSSRDLCSPRALDFQTQPREDDNPLYEAWRRVEYRGKRTPYAFYTPQEIIEGQGDHHNEVFHKPREIQGVFLLSDATNMDEVNASPFYEQYEPYIEYAKKNDLSILTINRPIDRRVDANLLQYNRRLKKNP